MRNFYIQFARFFLPLGVIIYTMGFSMVLPTVEPGSDIFFGFESLGVGAGLLFQLIAMIIFGVAASQLDDSKVGLVGYLLGRFGSLLAMGVGSLMVVFIIAPALLISLIEIADYPLRSLLTYSSPVVLFFVGGIGFERMYRKIFPKPMEGML